MIEFGEKFSDLNESILKKTEIGMEIKIFYLLQRKLNLWRNFEEKYIKI